MRWPILFAIVSMLLLAGIANGQMVCGPNGCYNVGSFNQPSYTYSAPIIRRPVIQRSYVTSQPWQVSSAAPTATASTASGSYSVADDGSVVAPDGGKVTKLGGVEIVAKSAKGFGSTANGSCNCDCASKLAALEQAIKGNEALLQDIKSAVTTYREPTSQSKPKPPADRAYDSLARLEEIHREGQSKRQLAMR